LLDHHCVFFSLSEQDPFVGHADQLRS